MHRALFSRPTSIPTAPKLPLLVFVLLSGGLLQGCQAIKDVFEAGVGVGVLTVVIVLAVVGGIITMMRK